MAKTRKIEVDERTANLLEGRAQARGLSVSDLVADLADTEEALPQSLVEMREEGRGPWSPEILAEDARRLAEYRRTGESIPLEAVEAWVRSWGTANELPPPKPVKI